MPDTPEKTGPATWIAMAALLAMAAGLILHVVAFEPVENILMFTQDDSLFYFQIAWNFPTTGRFSYDTLHDTYGFQPLWQIVLAGVAHFFGDREALLRFGILLLGLFHLAAGVVLFDLLRRIAGQAAGLAAAAFWLANVPLLEWSLAGKENVLYALLLLILLRHVHERYLPGSRPGARGFLLGVLGGLLFLSRVNSLAFLALLAAALGAAGLIHGRRSLLRRLLPLGVALVTALAVAGPWMAYARTTFGSILPTSGVAKLASSRNYVEDVVGASWHSPGHVLHTLGSWPGYSHYLWKWFSQPFAAWYLLCLVVGVVLLARRALGRGARPASVEPRGLWTLGILAAWAVGNSLINLHYLPRYAFYGRWYAVPEILVCTIAFGLLSAGLLRAQKRPWGVPVLALLYLALLLGARWPATSIHPRSLGLSLGAALVGLVLGSLVLVPGLRARGWSPGRAAVALCVLLCAAGAAFTLPFPPGADRASRKHPDRVRLYELGLWARDHVPEDMTLGAWSSGVLAYFSGRRVISLEGLVSESYYVLEGRADKPRYIREKGIEYVFGPGRRLEDGAYESARLPAGSYRMEWVPFPDYEFPWGSVNAYVLVRPLGVEREERLHREDFPYGLWRPGESEAPQLHPTEP